MQYNNYTEFAHRRHISTDTIKSKSKYGGVIVHEKSLTNSKRETYSKVRNFVGNRQSVTIRMKETKFTHRDKVIVTRRGQRDVFGLFEQKKTMSVKKYEKMYKNGVVFEKRKTFGQRWDSRISRVGDAWDAMASQIEKGAPSDDIGTKVAVKEMQAIGEIHRLAPKAIIKAKKPAIYTGRTLGKGLVKTGRAAIKTRRMIKNDEFGDFVSNKVKQGYGSVSNKVKGGINKIKHTNAGDVKIAFKKGAKGVGNLSIKGAKGAGRMSVRGAKYAAPRVLSVGKAIGKRGIDVIEGAADNSMGAQAAMAPIKAIQKMRLVRQRIQQAKKMAKRAAKVIKKIVQVIKAVARAFIKLVTTCWPAALALVCILAVCIIAASIGSKGKDEGTDGIFEDGMSFTSTVPFPQSVERYRKTVEEVLEQEGMGKGYTDLVLAIMLQESGGNLPDVMQSSESLGKAPNSITDPRESIVAGVKHLKSCIKKANEEGVKDIKSIVQSYNYGTGFLSYVKKTNDGVWNENVSKAFSSKMAQKMGWKSYGDPMYAKKVTKNLVMNKFESSKVSGKAHITQEKMDEIVNKAPTDTAKRILSYALSKEGYPYSQDVNKRASGNYYDCSSLVYFAAKNAGYDFGSPNYASNSRAEEQYCKDHGWMVDLDEIQAGDILFFRENGVVHHVAIYCGDGMIMHAACEEIGCVYQKIYYSCKTSNGTQYLSTAARLP